MPSCTSAFMRPLALRDHALLLFLYNTGAARVQEVADLRVGHLDFSPQPRLRLHGKRDKWRVPSPVGQDRLLLEQPWESGHCWKARSLPREVGFR